VNIANKTNKLNVHGVSIDFKALLREAKVYLDIFFMFRVETRRKKNSVSHFSNNRFQRFVILSNNTAKKLNKMI
jgi:hypothetical protein